MENIITGEAKEILTEILLDKAKRIAEDVLEKAGRKIRRRRKAFDQDDL